VQCEDFDGDTIRRKDCKILKVVPYHVLSQSRAALGGMATLTDLNGNVADLTKNPVLLDIDEDFFGVESPARSLHKLGKWPIKHLQAVTKKVGAFCPTDSVMEAHLHHTLVTAVKAGTPPAKVSLDLQGRTPALCKPDSGNVISHISKVVTSVQAAGKAGASLERLLAYGFCASPEAFAKAEFKKLQGKVGTVKLQVCTGNSTPTERSGQRVQFHTPAVGELPGMLDAVGGIARQFGEALWVVTICRSVRDGYTLRNMWRTVEAGILAQVKQAMVAVGQKSRIRYDESLWNGQQGPG